VAGALPPAAAAALAPAWPIRGGGPPLPAMPPRPQRGAASVDPPLPSSGAEFRSEAYWRAFFEARPADAAFEWYGDWRQLKPLLLPLCVGEKEDGSVETARVVVLGCGNSALSAQM